jgi:FkbM family methyltransferase
VLRLVRDRLIRANWLRHAVQAVRVAGTVQPAYRFALDVLRGCETGEYRSKRTGQMVALRPRLDLQVAREHVTKDVYAPPADVAGRLGEIERPRVLDAGANIGLFTINAIGRYDVSRVVAVEPDPENVVLLRRNVALNGYDERVDVVEAAVGTTSGTARFNAGHRELSHMSDNGGVEVAVVDFFAVARGCDLIKMDIEYGEWPLLRDSRLEDLTATAIVMEWHGGGSAPSDPAGAAEQLLNAAGYDVAHQGGTDEIVGQLWAVKRR